MVSLIIISGSTKDSNGQGNLTTAVNSHMMEEEEETHEKLDDVEKKNGKVLD